MGSNTQTLELHLEIREVGVCPPPQDTACPVAGLPGLPPQPGEAGGFLPETPSSPTSFFPLAPQGSSVQGVVLLFSQPQTDR